MNDRKLLLRADGNRHIGIGHLMRCLALAQIWDVNHTELLSGAITDELKEKTQRYCHNIDLDVNIGTRNDAHKVSKIIKRYDNPIIVLDGYHFGSEYQRIISETESTVLVIDDFRHANNYYADIIHNQGLYADRSLYPRVKKDTRFLLGPEYILLRNEFRKYIEFEPTISNKVTNVLLTFGGTDPDNITGLCLEAINKINTELSITIVLGPANQHYKSVADIAESGNHNVNILDNADNMSEIMSWAQIAISGSGTTIWELAFMGVPSILIDTASNQQSSAILDEMNVANRLGTADSILLQDIYNAVLSMCEDPRRRKVMSKSGQELVDGLGPERVLAEIS